MNYFKLDQHNLFTLDSSLVTTHYLQNCFILFKRAKISSIQEMIQEIKNVQKFRDTASVTSASKFKKTLDKDRVIYIIMEILVNLIRILQ